MKEKKIKIFYKDLTDVGRRTICAFDDNITNEQMKEYVFNYLKDNLLDTTDEYASLQTEKECEDTAEDIANGIVFDDGVDAYFIDELTLYSN